MSDKQFLSIPESPTSFEELIDENGYFVHKSEFIKTVFTDSAKVLLFTRPRRFGKTLLMTMFESFLKINSEKPFDTSLQLKYFQGTKILEDKEFCSKFMGQYPVISISLKNVDGVTFDIAYKNFATEYNIQGSENNQKIKELVLLQTDLQERVNRMAQSGIPVGIAQDSLTRMVDAYKDEVKRNYIFVAPNKPYAYFALFQVLNGYMIFDPLNNKEDVKCFAAVATSMNNLYPHADRSRNLYNMVIKGMKNTRAPQVKPLDIPADKIQEASIIDIPLMDIKGTVRHLTDLKGKVVLIDFTAYGSAESGARNLLLREIYDKYASQGLEIYQVSLDTDEHFWKTAADNLPWICVRDPQGPYSTYVRLYGVTQLPTAFLVGRNNELNMRIGPKTDLEEAIKKLL